MWESIISGLFSLLNNGLNITANKRAEERQQKYNQQAAAQQQAYNEKNMGLSYQYGEQAAAAADARTRALYKDLYSPEATTKAQMEAIKQNGLSPALMYGGAGIGSGSSTPSGAQGSSPSALSTNVIPATANNPLASANFALTWAQTANLLADTKKKNAEETGIDIENKLNEAIFETNINQAKAELDNTLADTSLKLTEKEITEIKKQTEKYQQNLLKFQDRLNQITMTQTIARIEAETERAIEEARAAKIQNKWSDKIFEKQVNLMEAQAAETWAKKALLEVQKEHEKKKIKLTEEQTKEIQGKIRNLAAEYWNIIADTMVKKESQTEINQKIEHLRAETSKAWSEAYNWPLKVTAEIIDHIIPF